VSLTFFFFVVNYISSSYLLILCNSTLYFLEKDEQLLKYSDVKDAYESCDRNGVVRLGSDAKSLMEQAKMFLEEEENKDKDSKK
tara:strand:+ start:78 stop:329 length:252 start_codon:yes stop_codon:yes gene_type:complete